MIETLAALIGRHVHYWASTAVAQHVRHDEVPFTARIVFVHPNGDVSVRGADHYGATFIDTHVSVLQAADVQASDLRHGHGRQDGYCTWPVITPPVHTPSQEPQAMHHHTISTPSSEPFGMQPLAAEQPREMTDSERRAALEVANVQQAAEDAKERRWQGGPFTAVRLCPENLTPCQHWCEQDKCNERGKRLLREQMPA